MTSEMKPITLYGSSLGPNPVKVLTIVKELSIPYREVYVPFNEVKSPSYVAINPNGRLPSIIDPNTGITLWESGAIIEYLIAHYDPQNLISFPLHSQEDFLTRQYLYFQVSGQGPYYGQAYWFLQAPEKLPLAIDRYKNEIKRVTAVLDSVLEGKEWLVGGKCTYADLSFIPWQNLAANMLSDEPGYLTTKFSNVKAWMKRMEERDSVKAVQIESKKAYESYMQSQKEAETEAMTANKAAEKA